MMYHCDRYNKMVLAPTRINRRDRLNLPVESRLLIRAGASIDHRDSSLTGHLMRSIYSSFLYSFLLFFYNFIVPSII